MESLCWQERAQRLLAPGDPEYLLRLEDQRDLAGEGERTAAALLIEEGILSPFPDNTLRPAAALTRAHAVKLLARAAEKAGAPGLVTAEFHGVAEGLLTVVEGGGESERAYQLDPGRAPLPRPRRRAGGGLGAEPGGRAIRCATSSANPAAWPSSRDSSRAREWPRTATRGTTAGRCA